MYWKSKKRIKNQGLIESIIRKVKRSINCLRRPQRIKVYINCFRVDSCATEEDKKAIAEAMKIVEDVSSGNFKDYQLENLKNR